MDHRTSLEPVPSLRVVAYQHTKDARLGQGHGTHYWTRTSRPLIPRRIDVGVQLPAAPEAAKLLSRAVPLVYVAAAAALLRGVGGIHPHDLDAVPLMQVLN